MGQDRPINALLPGFAQVHVFNSTRITPFIPVYMPIAMYLGVFAHNTPRSRVSACFHLPSTASTALHVLSKCQTRARWCWPGSTSPSPRIRGKPPSGASGGSATSLRDVASARGLPDLHVGHVDWHRRVLVTDNQSQVTSVQHAEGAAERTPAA